MQDKNHTFSDFLGRTDRLADSCGGNVSLLPDLIGISKAMFFGYRSGKYPITNKAWRKLEAAEKTAGITPGREEPPPKLVTRDELSPPVPDLTKKVNEMDEKLDRLIAVITDQAERIDALLEQRATSSSGRGRAVGSKPKKLV